MLPIGKELISVYRTFHFTKLPLVPKWSLYWGSTVAQQVSLPEGLRIADALCIIILMPILVSCACMHANQPWCLAVIAEATKELLGTIM